MEQSFCLALCIGLFVYAIFKYQDAQDERKIKNNKNKNMKTVQELYDSYKESNLPAEVVIDGQKFCFYKVEADEKDKSALNWFWAEKDKILIDYNNKVQKDIQFDEFKKKARVESLKVAPKMKSVSEKISIELTADEIIKEATIIYEWLIKDLK